MAYTNKLPKELDKTLMEQGFTENARVLVGDELVKARLDELELLGDKKADKAYKDERKATLEAEPTDE